MQPTIKKFFWKKIIFVLPSIKSGKLHIEKPTQNINSSINNLLLQDVVMPNLLLQKASRNWKSKKHLRTLKRKLDLWKERKLIKLLIEGETIQKSLNDSESKKTIVKLSKRFKNYMKKGDVHAALKLLSLTLWKKEYLRSIIKR